MLDSARRSLLHELEVEERKPIAIRVAEAEMDQMLANTVSLGRIIREIAG